MSKQSRRAGPCALLADCLCGSVRARVGYECALYASCDWCLPRVLFHDPPPPPPLDSWPECSRVKQPPC